jgi:hypothetical protein
MPRKLTLLERKQQPIHWFRAAVVGLVGTLMMMSWIDLFYLAGKTPFSFELYLGSLLRGTPYGDANWTIGFLVNLLVGSLFGIFYAYFFEYIYFRADVLTGLKVAIWHLLAAAILFFPYFGALHEFVGTGLHPHFGILGSGLGVLTPILITLGHLLFGASTGLLYGGVKLERARETEFEPDYRNIARQ